MSVVATSKGEGEENITENITAHEDPNAMEKQPPQPAGLSCNAAGSDIADQTHVKVKLYILWGSSTPRHTAEEAKNRFGGLGSVV